MPALSFNYSESFPLDNLWQNVGNAGFSAGGAQFLSLAFSLSGVPYIAYQNFAYADKASVMKYDYQDGINDLQQAPLFLYPNPSFDEICIETSENQNHSELSIINLDGQQIITRQITEPKTQLDISSLPRVVYFVRVTGERAVQVGKFLKQ